MLLAGASARTEQFLLERTAYWAEAATAAPPARGGVHLAFIGPDADVSGIKKPIRRLAPSLTASVHRETAGAYLSRLTSSAPCLVMGFNTGLGGGGSAENDVADDHEYMPPTPTQSFALAKSSSSVASVASVVPAAVPSERGDARDPLGSGTGGRSAGRGAG